MTVEAWCDKEAGVGPKCDSEEDLAGIDEGNQEELGLDEDQHHPAPLRHKFTLKQDLPNTLVCNWQVCQGSASLNPKPKNIATRAAGHLTEQGSSGRGAEACRAVRLTRGHRSQTRRCRAPSGALAHPECCGVQCIPAWC